MLRNRFIAAKNTTKVRKEVESPTSIEKNAAPAKLRITRKFPRSLSYNMPNGI